MLNISNFKSVICLNGNLPSPDFFRSVSSLGISIIAADGAAIKLIDMGVDPNFIVGDMDSFTGNVSEITEIIKVEDQNYTDFDKAITFMKERNLAPCLILGINGGEIDHILNNLATFVRYSHEIDIWFYDIPSVGQAKIGKSSSDLECNVDKGSTISLFSFSNGKITTKGLVWEIDSESFDIIKKSAARNCARSEKVMIRSSDKILTIIDAKIIH